MSTPCQHLRNGWQVLDTVFRIDACMDCGAIRVVQVIGNRSWLFPWQYPDQANEKRQGDMVRAGNGLAQRAAPVMLAALKLADKAMVTMLSLNHRTRVAIRAAIAEAEGEDA